MFFMDFEMRCDVKMYFKTSLSDFSKHIGEELLKCCEIKIQTNAQKIRAMTDEELAEFLEGDYGNMASGTALSWLKSPSE